MHPHPLRSEGRLKAGLQLIALLALLFILGCQRTPPEVKSARTAPFLTPGERARLPIEERDDPYTQMHTQSGPAPAATPR